MSNNTALRRLQRHAARSTTSQIPGLADLDKFLTDNAQAQPDDDTRRKWARDALEATRKRAEGWRNGAAATLALILASLAIKPGEGLMKYQGATRYWLMALVAASVVAALAAVYRLLRAANGPAWLLELPDGAPVERWIRRVAGARLDLQFGQQLWIASVVLFTAAVGVTWFQS